MTDTQLLEKLAEIVDTSIASQLGPIKQIQQEQSADLSEIRTSLHVQTKDIKVLKRKVSKTEKIVDIIARRYDQGIQKNAKDIQTIKSHLSIS
jgi:hypothetical protein